MIVTKTADAIMKDGVEICPTTFSVEEAVTRSMPSLNMKIVDAQITRLTAELQRWSDIKTEMEKL